MTHPFEDVQLISVVLIFFDVSDWSLYFEVIAPQSLFYEMVCLPFL